MLLINQQSQICRRSLQLHTTRSLFQRTLTKDLSPQVSKIILQGNLGLNTIGIAVNLPFISWYRLQQILKSSFIPKPISYLEGYSKINTYQYVSTYFTTVIFVCYIFIVSNGMYLIFLNFFSIAIPTSLVEC